MKAAHSLRESRMRRKWVTVESQAPRSSTVEHMEGHTKLLVTLHGNYIKALERYGNIRHSRLQPNCDKIPYHHNEPSSPLKSSMTACSDAKSHTHIIEEADLVTQASMIHMFNGATTYVALRTLINKHKVERFAMVLRLQDQTTSG